MSNILVVVSTKESAEELASEIAGWLTTLFDYELLKSHTTIPYPRIETKTGNTCIIVVAEKRLEMSLCGQQPDLLFVDEGVSVSREYMDTLMPLMYMKKSTKKVQKVDIKKIIRAILWFKDGE